MASLSNPAQVGDFSLAMQASAYGTACAANGSRSFLMIQYQGTGTGLFSFTNPAPGTGSSGAFGLTSSMAPLLFSPVSPGNALYLGTGTGTFMISQG